MEKMWNGSYSLRRRRCGCTAVLAIRWRRPSSTASPRSPRALWSWSRRSPWGPAEVCVAEPGCGRGAAQGSSPVVVDMWLLNGLRGTNDRAAPVVDASRQEVTQCKLSHQTAASSISTTTRPRNLTIRCAFAAWDAAEDTLATPATSSGTNAAAADARWKDEDLKTIARLGARRGSEKDPGVCVTNGSDDM